MKKRVKFLVCNHCNIDCNFCHREYQEPGGKTGKFKKRYISDVLTKYPSSDELIVKISGGEPLLYFDQVVKLIKMVKSLRNNCKFILLSNITLLAQRKLDILKEIGISEIRATMPSLDMGEYCRVTNALPKLFTKAISNSRMIRESGLNLRYNAVLQKCEDVEDYIKSYVAKVTKTSLANKVFFVNELKTSDQIFKKAKNTLEHLNGKEMKMYRGGRVFKTNYNSIEVGIGRCINWNDNDPAREFADDYIIPPGVPIPKYNT